MYANQKMVIINKQFNTSPSNGNIVFTSLNVAGLEQAISHLSAPGLRLYLYIMKNKDKYGFGLSLTDFMNTCRNMGKTSYYNGVKELIEEGFLIKVPDKKNLYLAVCYSQVCKQQDEFYARMHGNTIPGLEGISIDKISESMLDEVKNTKLG